MPERTGLAATHTRDVFYGYNVLDLTTYARFDSTTGEGVTQAYDALGRELSSTLLMDGASRAVSRARDSVNNRINLTYGGQTYRYDFDPAGRLRTLYEGTGTTTVLAAFQYNARGQVDLRTEGVASSVNPGYDAVGRLTSLAHAFATTSGNVTFGLPIYNPAGQIERFTRSNDSYAWTGGVEVDRAYSVNGLNQYTAAGTATFTYDANGNLTGDGSNTYTYDVENRLVAVSGARAANLRYDPLGRLYEIGAATPSRRLLWDGDALVAEYQTTTGTPLAARFVHGTAAGVDDPLVWYGGGENRRLHADHQGSVVAVTNGTGTATWINGYDEWGIPNATGNTGRFQYTGQIWIAELGMYHYKARIYSPTLGRFLQTDPVGYDDQVNLYAYVGNDPVNGTDPSGMYECASDAACRAAAKGAAEIRAARNFYRSAGIGSRIPASQERARFLDRTLSTLGTRGDGGVNINVGTLEPGTYGNYNSDTDTITLDVGQAESRARIGTVLGHEIQHRRQRNEGLSSLAEEVRPIAVEYIIGAAIGGTIRPAGGMTGRDYVRQRLGDYCRTAARYCDPAIERVIDAEFPKPF